MKNMVLYFRSVVVCSIRFILFNVHIQRKLLWRTHIRKMGISDEKGGLLSTTFPPPAFFIL